MEGGNEQTKYQKTSHDWKTCVSRLKDQPSAQYARRKKNHNKAYHHENSEHKGQREETINFQREQEKVIVKGPELQ